MTTGLPSYRDLPVAPGMPEGLHGAGVALDDDDGAYQFLLTAAPLNLHAGVGSPANAMAVK